MAEVANEIQDMMDIPPFPGKDERNFLDNLSSATLSDSFPLQWEVWVERVGEERRTGGESTMEGR